MIDIYVFVGENGYIQGYSLDEQQDTIKIQADQEELEQNFLAMKIEDGIAVLDPAKQEELAKQFDKPTDVQILQQQNANLTMLLSSSNEAIMQLRQQNAKLALSQSQIISELKSFKGGKEV